MRAPKEGDPTVGGGGREGGWVLWSGWGVCVGGGEQACLQSVQGRQGKSGPGIPSPNTARVDAAHPHLVSLLQHTRYSIPYFFNPKLNYAIQGPEKRWAPVTGFDLLSLTGELPGPLPPCLLGVARVAQLSCPTALLCPPRPALKTHFPAAPNPCPSRQRLRRAQEQRGQELARGCLHG